MPKEIEYPRASLNKSIEMAQAVYDLGGSCKIESCAQQMKKKDSGAFRALVSAADKYGLVSNNRGDLSTTELFREYKLAYSEKDENEVLKKAFLGVSLFQKITDRFKSTKIPTGFFDKLLIKEFGVNDQIASRVSKYFIDGAKLVGILNEDGTLSVKDTAKMEGQEANDETSVNKKQAPDARGVMDVNIHKGSDAYSVTISGPGIDSRIEVHEEEDLHLVDALLARVRKKLQNKSCNEEKVNENAA